MNLILSILAGVLGSAVGGAARVGVEMLERGGRRGSDEPVVINGSLTAAVAGGLLGTLLGGPRRAFWLAAVLSAAGAERLDARILSRAGIDYGALVDRAVSAARQAREEMMPAMPEPVEASAEAPAS
jgi:hypothetical protein